MTKINIMAMRHSAFYAPLLMTIYGGYLEKEGLQPIYSVASADNPADVSLREGRVDLIQSAPAVSFTELEQGKPSEFVHFAAINQRDGFFISARDPDNDFKWSDLEGEEVLVDHLFQPYATLRYVMTQNGADFDKIKIIDAGNVEQMDKAFRSGQGAFIHQQGPAPQQLEQQGIGNIVASVGEALGPIAFSSLCSTHEWLDSKMAQTFIHCYRQAMQDLVEWDSSKIAEVIQDSLPDVDHEVLTKTLNDYKKLNTWQIDTSINTDSYETLLRVFLFDGRISKNYPISSCIRNL